MDKISQKCKISQTTINKTKEGRKEGKMRFETCRCDGTQAMKSRTTSDE